MEFDLFHIRRGMEQGLPWDIEHRLICDDKTLKYVHAKGEAITDESGKVVQLIGTVQDITERKKTEKLNLELEQRRDNFVWMTSHELRTPLTVISGYIDIFEKHFDKIDVNQQHEILGIIRNNLSRFEKLTEQVSLIAQFKHGTFKIKSSEFEVNTFFDEVLEPYRNMLGENLAIEKHNVGQSSIIKGDKDRLLHVIDNLLNNAVKHTHPDDRMIRVNLGIQPTVLRIVVSDNGAGIAPENLEHIFKQFVSIQTEYSVTGTGIGLYISAKIIKAHGGTIRAHSEGRGLGATFIIELPRNH